MERESKDKSKEQNIERRLTKSSGIHLPLHHRNVEHCSVKPAHVVTSTKQSHVLKYHPFLALSEKYSYEFNLI